MGDRGSFWTQKPMAEFSHDEWESLCDGCAKCCLQQLEDEESGVLVFTDVACDLLNAGTCQCTDYEHRSQRVPSCMTLTPENIAGCAQFAPSSCAYRLVFENKPLPAWHHLQSGQKSSVHEAGVSVRGKVRKMATVREEDLEDYVVDWPELTR